MSRHTRNRGQRYVRATSTAESIPSAPRAAGPSISRRRRCRIAHSVRPGNKLTRLAISTSHDRSNRSSSSLSDHSRRCRPSELGLTRRGETRRFRHPRDAMRFISPRGVLPSRSAISRWLIMSLCLLTNSSSSLVHSDPVRGARSRRRTGEGSSTATSPSRAPEAMLPWWVQNEPPTSGRLHPGSGQRRAIVGLLRGAGATEQWVTRDDRPPPLLKPRGGRGGLGNTCLQAPSRAHASRQSRHSSRSNRFSM
jgi:hypothetical protein